MRLLSSFRATRAVTNIDICTACFDDEARALTQNIVAADKTLSSSRRANRGRKGAYTARILVIEDNPNNLQLAVYLLHAFGHDVSAATEGAEGIEMARHEKPDLILLDIHMPKMDGYEVVNRLRDDPDCRIIRIVAVTALAMVGDRERLLASGFDGYISKPIEPETFSAQVQGYFRIVTENPGIAP